MDSRLRGNDGWGGTGELPWLSHLTALTVFIFLALVATYPLILHLKTLLLAQHTPLDIYSGGDELVAFYNSWFFQRQLHLGQNPFWTDLMWWPTGYNLLFHVYSPLHSVFVYLFQSWMGHVGALNLSYLFCLVMGAYGAFLLARRMGCSTWPGILVGAIVSFNPYVMLLIDGSTEYLGFWPLIFFIWRFYVALEDKGTKNYLIAGIFLSISWFYAQYYLILGLVMSGLMVLPRIISVKWISLDKYRPIIKTIRNLAMAGSAAGLIWVVAELYRRGGQITFAGEGSMKEIFFYVLPYWTFVGSLLAWFASTRKRLPFLGSIKLGHTWREITPLISTWMWWILLTLPLIVTLVRILYGGAGIEPPQRWRGGGSPLEMLCFLIPNKYNPLWRDFLPNFLNASRWDYGLGWTLPLILIWHFRKHGLPQSKYWLYMGIATVIFMLGPYPCLGGFNLYFPLPFYFLRLLPFGSNIQGTGRFVVVAYLFFGLVLAMACEQQFKISKSFWRGGGKLLPLSFLLIGLEFLFPLPRSLDDPYKMPSIFQRFKNAPDGPVLMIPFSATLRYARTPYRELRHYMRYQMIHQHPIVGGCSGRTAYDLNLLYKNNPFLRQINDAQNSGKIGPVLIDPAQIRMGLKMWGVRYIVIEDNKVPDSIKQTIKTRWPVKLWGEEEEITIYSVALPT